MQILAAVLIVVLVSLHYLLWIDEDGVRQMRTLRVNIRAQIEENADLAERNKGLDAEVQDLKNGLMAIEERARSEMGMIRPDETFYHLLDKPVPPPRIPQDKAVTGKAMAPAGKPVPKPTTLKSAMKPVPKSTAPKPAAKSPQ